MNSVEPIRDMNTVLDIADYLKEKNERDYLMYMFGIYTGLRISDILKFRVREVRERNSIYIREKKTGKEKRFILNQHLKQIIAEYISGKKNYEYLFPSPKKRNAPISRQQAYNVIREAGEHFGVLQLGTHTLRKTFGYHMYQKNHDAAMLMDLFNHASIDITLRYIGVNQDNKDKAMKELKYQR